MSKQIYRYLNLLSDFGFKHVFGREKNKDILIAFLNALFQGKKTIIDLVYSPTEYASETSEHKKVFFDLMCTGTDGEQIIIEMQRKNQRYFRDRSVYYMSRLTAEQLPPGQSNWSEPLKEIYFIAILDFSLKDSTKGTYIQKTNLINTESGKLFYDKTHYIFIELLNFDKNETELVTNLDKWIYLLKNMHDLKKLPVSLDKPIFQKIFNIAEINKLTKEERMLFDRNLKNQMDYDASIRFAAEEAAEKAAKETAEKTQKCIAHKLEKMGMSKSQILEITDLSAVQLTNPTG